MIKKHLKEVEYHPVTKLRLAHAMYIFKKFGFEHVYNGTFGYIESNNLITTKVFCYGYVTSVKKGAVIRHKFKPFSDWR